MQSGNPIKGPSEDSRPCLHSQRKEGQQGQAEIHGGGCKVPGTGAKEAPQAIGPYPRQHSQKASNGSYQESDKAVAAGDRAQGQWSGPHPQQRAFQSLQRKVSPAAQRNTQAPKVLQQFLDLPRVTRAQQLQKSAVHTKLVRVWKPPQELRGSPTKTIVQESQSQKDDVQKTTQAEAPPRHPRHPWPTSIKEAQEGQRQWESRGGRATATPARRRNEGAGQVSRKRSPRFQKPPRERGSKITEANRGGKRRCNISCCRSLRSSLETF